MIYTVVTLDPLNKFLRVQETYGEKNADDIIKEFKYHGGPSRVAYKIPGVVEVLTE